MDDLKKALIFTIENSKVNTPLELFSDLLTLLYSVGYADGQRYRESEDEYYGELINNHVRSLYPDIDEEEQGEGRIMNEEVKNGYQPTEILDEDGNQIKEILNPPKGGTSMQDN